jgi:hypothetical protein
MTTTRFPFSLQGANYDRSTDPPVKIYPGDDQIRRADELTIQIHTLQVQKNRDVIADNVPTITVWVPQVMAGQWVSQPQGQ